MDRPITYGLFLRHTSLATSLWLSVIAQALITGALMFYLISKFLEPSLKREVFFIVTIFVLCLCSSLPWIASMLLADSFSAISLLVFVILLLFSPTKKWQISLFCILYWVSTAMHLTHASSHLIVIVFIGFMKIWGATFFQRIAWKKWLFICTMVVLNFVFLPLLHLSFGAGFVNARAGHVFITGKMVESGAMKAYLDANCVNNNYNLCQFKDSLPKSAPDFIWQKNSPFYKLGEWNGNVEEYKKINYEILATPKFLNIYVKSYWLTFKNQITAHDIGEELLVYGAESPPGWSIHDRFKNEYSNFLHAKQALNTWPSVFKPLNKFINSVFWMAVIYLVFVIVTKQVNSLLIVLIQVTGLIYISNILVVCIASSGCRYNTRMDWVLIFLALLSLLLQIKPTKIKHTVQG